MLLDGVGHCWNPVLYACFPHQGTTALPCITSTIWDHRSEKELGLGSRNEPTLNGFLACMVHTHTMNGECLPYPRASFMFTTFSPSMLECHTCDKACAFAWFNTDISSSCLLLLDVVGSCWMLLDVVGCCWMLLDANTDIS